MATVEKYEHHIDTLNEQQLVEEIRIANQQLSEGSGVLHKDTRHRYFIAPNFFRS